jgi:hypothetical protein
MAYYTVNFTESIIRREASRHCQVTKRQNSVTDHDDDKGDKHHLQVVGLVGQNSVSESKYSVYIKLLHGFN